MTKPLRLLINLAAVLLIGYGLTISEDLSDASWLTILFGAWVLLLIGTRVSLPKSMPVFNRSLIRTASVLATVFLLISAQLVRMQAIERDAIYYRTGTDDNGEVISNPRLVTTRMNYERGRIYDRNGTVLADSVQQDGTWYRTWPVPSTWPVTGYYSPGRYGSTGLEFRYEEQLQGLATTSGLDRALSRLLNEPTSGVNLNLTLDSIVQTRAADLLGDNAGAVVVLDVRTGATIALVSNPRMDPNQLFSPVATPSVTQYWDQLNDAPDSPFVTRANLGLYTPGSTFKTISAAIAINEGIAQPESVYQDNGSLEIQGRTLIEQNRPDDTRDSWTLQEGIGWSLNVVFAQVGMQIGGPLYWEYGPKLGFGEAIPYDLPVAESQIASSRKVLESTNMVADTGFGQGQLQLSPLHLAMIAATWANNGTMMQPYLVDTMTDANGKIVWVAEPKAWKKPITPETAEAVRSMMIWAVQNGAVQLAQADGYVVGGKTGTAELGDGQVNSLFIGFIGQPEPRYAVAVVIEGGGVVGQATQTGRDVLVLAMQRGSSEAPAAISAADNPHRPRG